MIDKNKIIRFEPIETADIAEKKQTKSTSSGVLIPIPEDFLTGKKSFFKAGVDLKALFADVDYSLKDGEKFV